MRRNMHPSGAFLPSSAAAPCRAIVVPPSMKMLLGLSESLPSLVHAKFASAKASEALVFSATELAIVRTSAGIPVRI